MLGLDRSGRLVIAELKRDRAPDTVEMQAIKYAAMASRFTPELLSAAHAKFLRSRGEQVDESSALKRLTSHCEFDLAPDELARPRIVLVASGFPSVVTAATVWLTEMGLDITLVRVQAYRTDDETVLAVSQLYPVPDVEEFMVAPRQAQARATSEVLPSVDWTQDDLRLLKSFVNATATAALNLCAATPGAYVPLREIESRANRTPAQARGDLAGLTMTVKRRFGRSNWPFDVEWAAGGEQQAYYRMDPDTAAIWRQLEGSG